MKEISQGTKEKVNVPMPSEERAWHENVEKFTDLFVSKDTFAEFHLDNAVSVLCSNSSTIMK